MRVDSKRGPERGLRRGDSLARAPLTLKSRRDVAPFFLPVAIFHLLNESFEMMP